MSTRAQLFSCLLVIGTTLPGHGAAASAAANAAANVPASETGFAVVVNADNPVTVLSRRQLSDLFLRKIASWPDGTPVLPVDLAAAQPVRRDFSLQVLGRPMDAVKAFWTQQIFRGLGVPPPEKAGPEEVIAYVKANRGAIGYVPAGLPLGPAKPVAVQP